MDFIEISGYKSIKSAKIDLTPINILIGANGSGKSNLLSFFELLNKAYDKNLREHVALSGGQDKMLHKGSKITNSISVRISFENSTNEYSFTIKNGEDNFVFTEEQLWYLSKPWSIATFAAEAAIKSHVSFKANYIRGHLNRLKKYHFHDTSKNSPFTTMSHIENDCYFLYESGQNLAAYLFYIRENHRIVYNQIIKTIQSIAPYFSDFYLQPNSEKRIRLQWQDKYSSNVYGANDLSDGTIRFIALTTLFLQPTQPDSIIIDEPELGLHPFAITKLAGMIQAVAQRGVQVILATQSADLVNHFLPKDIITVDQRDGESIFARLQEENFENWLNDYSIGDLWQRNVIKGGQPN